MIWLKENLFTLLFGLLLILIFYLLSRSMFKQKGKGGCGCSCSGCSGSCPHCIQFKEETDQK